MTVEFYERSFATSYSPNMTPSNKLSLNDKDMKKSNSKKGQGVVKKRKAWVGVGLCFPWKRRLLLKDKKLAHEGPHWL